MLNLHTGNSLQISLDSANYVTLDIPVDMKACGHKKNWRWKFC